MQESSAARMEWKFDMLRGKSLYRDNPKRFVAATSARMEFHSRCYTADEAIRWMWTL
jgi:hypothetical protein